MTLAKHLCVSIHDMQAKQSQQTENMGELMLVLLLAQQSFCNETH